ncbi:MAG: saccharopine dehydrogenase C-terminal domain-containing protein [Chitinophagaceae bacterium]
MTIAVLGAGMVGRAIALDLARDYAVTSFDRSPDNLQALQEANPRIGTRLTDLSGYNSYPALLQPFDLAVTAVPGFMGYQTLEAVIRAGKNVVDISFFPEDALQLDGLARDNGVTAVTDCGVAPGMSNFILGRCNAAMDVTSFECYVGGLPEEKQPPFFYKAPFSPVDVIQEYIRPARLVENGKIVVKPALSDREMIGFDEVGELEAFNTDGLRSLLYTMGHVPDMKEKTLRYPGHVELIIALQQAGFFDTVPLHINGTDLSPLAFTSRLLVNDWKAGPGDREFTVMKVVVKGTRGGKERTIEYNLLDRYDAATHTSSMARTTGYTCTAAVNLVAKGLFTEKGVFPPELIGSHQSCFDFVMDYLQQRKVNWISTER